MKYVILEIGGKQYKALEGSELKADHIRDAKTKIVLDKVLLLVNEDKVDIGKPYLRNVKVTASVLGDSKGKKIRIAKFKAKSRYRRVSGFRPLYTSLKVEKIDLTK